MRNFSVKNWNTPIIMDLKECNVSLIMLCEKYVFPLNPYNIRFSLPIASFCKRRKILHSQWQKKELLTLWELFTFSCAWNIMNYFCRYFLLVDGGLIHVYNYEGRMQCLLKLPSMNISGEAVSEKTATISNDTIAIRDRTDLKTVHFFDTITGKSAGNGKLVHTVRILWIFK